MSDGTHSNWQIWDKKKATFTDAKTLTHTLSVAYVVVPTNQGGSGFQDFLYAPSGGETADQGQKLLIFTFVAGGRGATTAGGAAAANNNTVTGVSDSSGNSYQKVMDGAWAAPFDSASNVLYSASEGCAILETYGTTITNTLSAGDTITVTLANYASYAHVWILRVDGLDMNAAADISPSGQLTWSWSNVATDVHDPTTSPVYQAGYMVYSDVHGRAVSVTTLQPNGIVPITGSCWYQPGHSDPGYVEMSGGLGGSIVSDVEISDYVSSGGDKLGEWSIFAGRPALFGSPILGSGYVTAVNPFASNMNSQTYKAGCAAFYLDTVLPGVFTAAGSGGGGPPSYTVDIQRVHGKRGRR